MIRAKRQTILVLVIAALIGLILYLEPTKPKPMSPNAPDAIACRPNPAKSAKFPCGKEITSPDGFINTPSTSSGRATPITIGEFMGKKVVLVDFWTYSCINCQRTFPYLNAWQEKYADGLVIIGVHTPEFEFEKKFDNVQAAVKKFGIKYPVVLDNDYSTWTSYQNRYWPRKYLIDIDGYIVYDHIGEGGYAETEKKIQELLAERAKVLGEKTAMPEKLAAAEITAPTPTPGIGSPEIYFGAARNAYLANGLKNKVGPQTLTAPTLAGLNELSLVGDWNIQNEFAGNLSAGAKIIFRYRAKDVYFVAASDKPVKVKVRLDGGSPGSRRGSDGDGTDTVTVQTEGLYKIIQNPDGIEEHTLELEIEAPGLRAFTFTFG